MLFRIFFQENGKIKSVKIEERNTEKAKQKALKTKLEGRNVTIIHALSS